MKHYICSHPKYRAALFKKFPSLMCAPEPQPEVDLQSLASGVTAVSE